jgi:hypothetical protein
LGITISRRPDESQSNLLLVEVSMADPTSESLMRYLASGAIESARTLIQSLPLDDWIARLRAGTFGEPLGPVVAGYALLRVEAGDRLPALCEALADAYPWLADAGVLRAWSQLGRPRAPGGDNARAAFLEAASRGIPAFSAGLRLLYNGLRLFLSPGDEEVQRAAGSARALASAADWSRPLTTFTGERPDAPSLKSFVGMAPEGPACVVANAP